MVPVPLVGIDRRRWCGRRAIPWDKPWDRKELKYLRSTGSWARRIMHHVQIQQDSHCCSSSHSYHAHMEISKAWIDEILQKLKDLFACRWDSRDIGTFVEGVDDNVGWAEIREQEHFFQVLRQKPLFPGFCASLPCSEYGRVCQNKNRTEQKAGCGADEAGFGGFASRLTGIPEVESK